MRRTISGLVFAAASLGPAVGFAQQWQGTYTPAMPTRPNDVENIGNAGQIVFGVERVTGLFIDSDTTDWQADGVDNEETQSTTTVGVFGASATPTNGSLPTPSSLPRLALDYLIIDGLSVGGSLTYVSHAADFERVSGSAEETVATGTVSVFYVNPRIGYAFPFNDTIGLWPRVGVAYANRSGEFESRDPGPPPTTPLVEQSFTNWQLTADAMLYVSPFEHFAVMLGPYLDLGLGGSFEESRDGNVLDERNSNLRSFGLSAAVVGYY